MQAEGLGFDPPNLHVFGRFGEAIDHRLITTFQALITSLIAERDEVPVVAREGQEVAKPVRLFASRSWSLESATLSSLKTIDVPTGLQTVCPA